jgi:hypothetical protein
VTLLKAVIPVFAVALAAVVRDPAAADETGDAGGAASPFADGTPTADDDETEGRRAENWWKRGEPPPF